MSRLLEKARRALLTDPITGEWLETGEIASLCAGLAAALVLIIALIDLALGLGAGQ